MARSKSASRAPGGTTPSFSGTAPDRPGESVWRYPRIQHGALVALGLALLVYFTSLPGEFVFDDEPLILENPLVTDPRRLPEIFVGPQGLSYRPIRTLSYAVDFRIWELHAAGYHLSNILYHGLVSLLVFVIAGLLGLPGPVALLSGALFAVHPVHTDAVSYISGRRDVLSSLFYLAGFACFLKDRKDPSLLTLLGVFVFYLLGIGTKEMAATLPVVCLAYHLTWGRGAEGERGRTAWFYALFFTCGIAFSYHAVSLEKGVTLSPTYHGGSLWITLLTMTRVFCHYVGLLALPIKLSADYSPQVIPYSIGLFEPRTLVAALATVGCGLLPFFWIWRRPRLAFGLFWYWLTLGPVSQIVPHTEMAAEHYLYLPSVAYCVGLAALLAHGIDRLPRAGAGLTLAILLVLGARTIARCEVWQNSYTLWSTTVADHPGCARARTNLGLALEKLDRLDEAERQYQVALALLPDDAYTLSNLGSLLLQVGRPREARTFLEGAVRRYPGYYQGHTNLGAVLCELGELKGSEEQLRRALAIKPDHLSAMLNLGMTLRRAGPSRHPEAQALYHRVLELDPGNVSARNNLGALLIAMGRASEAVALYEEVVRQQPGVALFWLNLAKARVAAGHAKEAASALLYAVRLEAESRSVQLEGAWLAQKMGQTSLARQLYQRAVELGGLEPSLAKELNLK